MDSLQQWNTNELPARSLETLVHSPRLISILDKIVILILKAEKQLKTWGTNHQSLKALYRKGNEHGHILLMASLLHYSNGITKKISNAYLQSRQTFHIFPETS